MADDRDKLIAHLARLESTRRGIADARKQLRGRAREQLDTMPDAVSTCTAARRDDVAGVLGHRRHKALLHERNHLERLASDGDR
jgi:hypothetical protein